MTLVLIFVLTMLVCIYSYNKYEYFEFEKYNSILMQDSSYSNSFNFAINNLMNKKRDISIHEQKIISHNTLLALLVLKKYNKTKRISDFYFNEYVLPPIVHNERAELWRESCLHEFAFLLNTDSSISYVCDTINRYLRKQFNYTSTSLNYLNKSWSDYKCDFTGNCIDMSKVVLYPLRSLGYPTAIDYVVAWGNTNGSHYWNSVYTDGKMRPFMGLENTIGYDPFCIYTHVKDSTKDGKRYPAKVLRYTFSINEKYKKIKEAVGRESKFKIFFNLYFEDVTSEYFETGNIILSVSASKEKVLYIAIFNNDQWIPIAANFLKNGIVLFPEMKKRMLYLLINSKYEAILPPFILNDSNKISFLNGHESESVDIKVRYLQSRIMEYQYGWAHLNTIPDDYFNGIAEDYYRKKPNKNELYKLYMYNNKYSWEFVAESFEENGILTFQQVPQNRLYLIKDAHETIMGRCFTYENGTIIYW